MKEIKIKPIANYHGLFLITLGAILLIVFVTIGYQFNHSELAQYRLALLFLTLVSLVIIFIGVVKKIEPEYAYVLAPEFISYQHKYGHWKIAWCDIQSIDNIKLHSGLMFKHLPYIGIKLTPETYLEKMISPRLASRLIHEQRPLMLNAITNQLLPFEQAQINFSPFINTQNEETKGPIAAFMHHSNALQQAYGFHLYLPVSSFDRPSEEFLQLLKSCQAYAKEANS